ncbi:MAG TPA: alpha-ketoacid dehydrogenase subunit beta [Methanomassiliicoccales archaeon]|nr:alpha-ketoacid dehydrogenase subunit beta [Methanomassiliicoccales archaeon]
MAEMTVMNMVSAINLALREEMERDQRVIVLGEDVGLDGGVFRVTEGLYDRFGASRVIDTPLAESAIVGASIGMAINGLRPVAEVQFMGFMYPALNQLISHAARMRNRSRGRLSVPMVVRAPYGAGVKALEHHSESTEALFCQIPGLTVVVPSTPLEVKGLLTSSIRDPDPVIFLEPTRSYRLLKEEVPDGEYLVPLRKARMVQDGKDVTVIGWGAMLPLIQKAVEDAKAEGISVEVLDLRTLSPLDWEKVIGSVRKTGRAVVVQEAPRTCGLAAEIAARIGESALLSLKAPVERVTAPDITVPLPKGENYYYISPARILNGIRRVMSF